MERKGFIGGSDCVQIMQGNWLDLWQIKTGRKEPAVRRGGREPAPGACRRTGY